MMQPERGIPRPLERSKARLIIGKQWFTLRRYGAWYFSGVRFAKVRQALSMPHLAFHHSSILLRELRDVEMWLQHNKVENLRIAIARLNGVLLGQGEVFSYWRLIGKPTARKGYKTGMVLYNGQVRHGTGGGLCQLSNLIYWMTLHTPLTVKERWRHSFDVFPDAARTQPFGSGATCAYNYIDLQIANETRHPFQLKLWMDDRLLHGEWRSTCAPDVRFEIFERDHLIRSEHWGGYSRHNKIFRRRYAVADGSMVGEDFVAANHALMMYEPLLPRETSAAT
jgi:vancomycin resistance protein VanW